MIRGKRRGAPRITLTEGAIRVVWGERILTILPIGQPPDSADPPDFAVDLDRILVWDAPRDDEEIGVEELLAIAQAIEDEFERLGLSVEFE